MAELINLNKARKAKARVADKSKAAENRVRFGQTKGQKLASEMDADRARRELTGKKRED